MNQDLLNRKLYGCTFAYWLPTKAGSSQTKSKDISMKRCAKGNICELRNFPSSNEMISAQTYRISHRDAAAMPRPKPVLLSLCARTGRAIRHYSDRPVGSGFIALGCVHRRWSYDPQQPTPLQRRHPHSSHWRKEVTITSELSRGR